jgi:hypothetical protein
LIRGPLTHEAFQAGVDLLRVANWLRTLESIPPSWESEACRRTMQFMHRHLTRIPAAPR